MPDEGHLFTSYNFKLADACVVCADLINKEGKLCKGLLVYELMSQCTYRFLYNNEQEYHNGMEREISSLYQQE